MRRCSECGGSLEDRDPRARTCSSTCRSGRSKRLKKIRKEAALLPPHQKEMADRVRGAIPDLAHDVIQNELVPVVRESMTQEALNAIRDLIGLTPTVVAKLTEDLASENDKVRQKATELVLRYTVGHPAIVTAPESDKTQPLQINFALPRPEQPALEAEVSAVSEIDEIPASTSDIETKPCDTCGADKSLEQFVEGSDRCTTCFNAQQQRAQQILESTS